MIKHLILLKIRNMMDIKGVLISMVYKFFDKKSSGGGIKNTMSDQQLAEKLHKPYITKSGFFSISSKNFIP